MAKRSPTPVATHIDPADGQAVVSVVGAAALTGHTRATVYRWIRNGRVRTRRLAGNGRLRVEVASLYEVDAAEPPAVDSEDSDE